MSTPHQRTVQRLHAVPHVVTKREPWGPAGSSTIKALGAEVDRLEAAIVHLVPGIRHIDLVRPHFHHSPSLALWCLITCGCLLCLHPLSVSRRVRRVNSNQAAKVGRVFRRPFVPDCTTLPCWGKACCMPECRHMSSPADACRRLTAAGRTRPGGMGAHLSTP